MSTDATPPPRKRRFRKTKIFLAVLLLLGVCFAAYRLTLVAMIHAKLDAIRKAGEPTTWAELVASLPPPPPPGENAADVYQQAFKLYADPGESRTNLPGYSDSSRPLRSSPLTQEMKLAIADYKAKNVETLRLVRKAAAMKRCAFPLTLNESLCDMFFPYSGQLQRVADLLRFEAMLDADEGKCEQTTDSITTMFAVAGTLRETPTLPLQVLRVGMQDMSCTVFERVLSQIALTNDQLVRLSSAVQDTEDSSGLRRALVTERCFFKNVRDACPPSERAPAFDHFVFFLYGASGMGDLDYFGYLNLMTEAIKASRIDYPDCIRRFRQIGERADTSPFMNIQTSSDLITIMGPVHDLYIRHVALGRVTATALATEQFRNDHTRLPDQLSELVPKYLRAVPTDPFDGQPLRYRKLSPPQRGYVIYSVGMNEKDDGGVSESKCWPSLGVDAKDITFTIER